MAIAMTAGAAATGGRVWLAAHSPHWMTPRRLKAVTVQRHPGRSQAAHPPICRSQTS
jgi:hypothetical protein